MAVGGGGGLLTLLSLTVTFSRGAWLAAGGVLMVWVWQQRQWRSIAGLFLVAGSLFYTTGVKPLFWQHLQTLWQGDYHSNLSRLQVWASGGKMLWEHALTGIGILHFERVYPDYALTLEPMAHLHNLYLQILVESGVVVGGLFLILLVLLSRHYAIYRDLQSWHQAICLSLLALGVFGWWDYPLADGRVLFVATSLGIIGLSEGNDAVNLVTKPPCDTHTQSHHQG